MFLSVFLASGREVVVDAVREGLSVLERADEFMEGLASVDDGCKARVGGREDDVVDGCQVLIGVAMGGEQVTIPYATLVWLTHL